MKKSILLLFLLFISTGYFSFASYSIDWMHQPNILTSEGTAIARDAFDNVYTTTSTTDIYLEKRDKFGNLLWQQRSFTTVPLNYEFPSQVHVDPFGNPIVIGYRHTTSGSGRIANAIIVLKYDPSGALLFKININGSFSNYNNSTFWTKVTGQVDAVGNIYIGTAGSVTGYALQGFNVLKVDPVGNIMWVSTKNFPSATGFHFVSQLRMVDDKIGLTGVTSYSSANATTWVLDTTGADLWNAVSTGVQGKDITFDAAGNAYMLTWISISQSGDVALYKFDPLGNLVWNHTYDFGGSDLAARMEKTPDGNLAIMAYGNSTPNGSYYTDWITFLTDTAGNLLWSDRYNEHTGNDEYPGMMAVDAANNIYVTGIGGPFPGGANLGKRQMVTVKYSPNGIREWASAIDTINEYLEGIGMTVASDNSLFVIGDVNTFIVHYLDHTGSSACVFPSFITATAISDSTATISWSPVTNAYLYHLQYKTQASSIWETFSTNDTALTLSSLFPGTLYAYRVEAICNSGPTGYTNAQQFTTIGNGYCMSEGLDASHEWIDLVFIESLLNSTPDSDSGYADFTYLDVDLLAGNTYDITLSAGMDIALYSESWKVWIDFNRDGDFTGPGEEVVSYLSSQIGWETNSIHIPASAVPGQTIMRVSMKNGSQLQTPCEIFGLGEVEDYTVNIGSLTSVSLDERSEELNVVYHPESNSITIIGRQIKGADYFIQFTDITGRNIVSLHGNTQGNIEQVVSLPGLASGVYLLSLHTVNQNLVKQLPIMK
ncbi:MAG: GEVED domain-containing protein [Bacteroidota bacterium]